MDILISEDLQSPALERLAKQFSVQRDGKLWEDPARLQAEIQNARVLIVRNQTQVTAKIMEAAPKLIGIGRVGVGLDNIDVNTATKLGIVVVAPLNANAVSVAELAFGLILALARKVPEGDRSTKAGGWDRRGFTGIELDGKTLGICGFGRIGGMVAARAKAFGMKLMVYDPVLKADSPAVVASGATYCAQLEELLGNSDFVSLHLPLVPATKKLFNAKMFAAMKPGSFFINTSRGGVMDETDLIAALLNKHLAGAALDVREIEPPGTKGVLETLPNVVLMPHVGAFTIEAQKRTFEAVADDMEHLLKGQPAANFVNIAQPNRK
jgi:D-3-phosphoglycerate dehydrogenase